MVIDVIVLEQLNIEKYIIIFWNKLSLLLFEM